MANSVFITALKTELIICRILSTVYLSVSSYFIVLSRLLHLCHHCKDMFLFVFFYKSQNLFYVFLVFSNFCFFVLIENHDLNFTAKYGDCYIEERNDSPVGVYNGGIPPTVYSCRSATSGGNKVHVFSNFGNSASNETTVEISGDSPDPVSVVLSNYHKVHWRVVLRGTLVPNIYLVSSCFKDKFKAYTSVYSPIP